MNDTTFSRLRWGAALWLVGLGFRIAPKGDAKDALAYYQRHWISACQAAWENRYGQP